VRFRAIRSLIQKHHSRKPFELLARAAGAYLSSYWNENMLDMGGNGEAEILRRCSSHLGQRPVAVDAGSNRGDWTAELLRVIPESTVHCFEIVPTTAIDTINRFRGDIRVTCNSVGLSAESGEVKVTTFHDSDAVSSITPLAWNEHTRSVLCKVVKGDDYLRDHHLDHIDILKCDTEGHDLFVLKGFSGLLSRRPIPIIQFEYGHQCIPARVYLRDFYEYLTPLGYSIGRLFPGGARISEYRDIRDEHFRSGNYIAVHSSYGVLTKAIAVT